MRIGIDLGGTKIEGILLRQDGQEIGRRRVATPAQDYHAILRAIADLVAALEQIAARRCTIGVGTPGAISRASGLIKNSNTAALNGRPLDRDLAAMLRRPIRLANDANCFALSEAIDGAAADAHVVFGAILGTGCGGGIVVDRRDIVGVNAIAGEWGHNPLPWSDVADAPPPSCYCGRSGCIETYLSGPGFAADHARRNDGTVRDAQAIFAAAAGGEAAAEASVRLYERRLAKALAGLINILDPEVIVLGGGLSENGRLYRNVPALWHEYVFSDQVATALRPPRHGASSGVRGAAWLWPQDAAP